MSLQSTIFKLGKGFDTGSSEELTELCRLLGRDRRIVFRTMHSGSKSQQLETTAGSADASPAIQNRTGPLRFDCQRHDQHQWSGKRQQDRGDHQIDEPPHLFSDPSLFKPFEETKLSTASHCRSESPHSEVDIHSD